MKNEEMENMLNNIKVPEPEYIMERRELKMPFLSYRRSSKAGLWLLLLPLTVALAVILKSVLAVKAGYINLVYKFFAAIDNNAVLTYLIPLLFVGLPLLAMIINALAICHFQNDQKNKELIITIKHRPFNIAVILISLAVLIFFLLPDNLSFS